MFNLQNNSLDLARNHMTVPYKNLKDYTNAELILFLENIESNDLRIMAGICSEVLRRMNETSPVLMNKKNEPS